MYDGEELTDTHTCEFGIRTMTVDAKRGLLINGKSVKLRGGCLHHTHAALGAADYPAAVERQLRQLKEAGFNAIRSAHNPPSLTMLSLCDRLGIYLMDEAFDMWRTGKTPMDYHLWFEFCWDKDIAAMVLRDRNHPSVISYSIGNEIMERGGASEGAKWSRKLTDEIRKYDSTRPVTSGLCGVWMSRPANAPEAYLAYYNENRFVFAEFSPEGITFFENDLRFDEVAGIDMIYWQSRPLGDIESLIPFGNGIYLRYNGIPNGSSLILGAGQYTFGSAPSAQTVTIDIPMTYDAENNPELIMDEGVIQVNGYGDPIGAHRSISRKVGRSPNFTAIAHKTYFGSLPDVRIPVTPLKNFIIRMLGNVDDINYTITFRGDTLQAKEDGTYSGTNGTYTIKATKATPIAQTHRRSQLLRIRSFSCSSAVGITQSTSSVVDEG